MLPELLFLHFIGHIAFIPKWQTGKDIQIGILKLCLDRLGFFRFCDNVLCQRFRIGNGAAAEHMGGSLLLGNQNTCHLQRNSVIIKVTQAGIRLPQVGIQSQRLIINKALGIQHHPELHIHNFLKGPFLLRSFDIRSAVDRFKNRIHLGLGLQSQSKQGHIVQFVVFIHNQHDFIVTVRPLTMDIILLLQQRTDQASFLRRQHLCPKFHTGSRHHPHPHLVPHRYHGRHIRIQIFLHGIHQHGFCIRKNDLPIYRFCVDHQVKIIGILNSGKSLGELTFRIF